MQRASGKLGSCCHIFSTARDAETPCLFVRCAAGCSRRWSRNHHSVRAQSLFETRHTTRHKDCGCLVPRKTSALSRQLVQRVRRTASNKASQSELSDITYIRIVGTNGTREWRRKHVGVWRFLFGLKKYTDRRAHKREHVFAQLEGELHLCDSTVVGRSAQMGRCAGQ